jgi:hypothetical protein
MDPETTVEEAAHIARSRSVSTERGISMVEGEPGG